MIDGQAEAPKALKEVFFKSGVSVVSKTIRTNPSEVDGLCKDLCRAAESDMPVESLTGPEWIGFVKSVLKFCMK